MKKYHIENACIKIGTHFFSNTYLQWNLNYFNNNWSVLRLHKEFKNVTYLKGMTFLKNCRLHFHVKNNKTWLLETKQEKYQLNINMEIDLLNVNICNVQLFHKEQPSFNWLALKDNYWSQRGFVLVACVL